MDQMEQAAQERGGVIIPGSVQKVNICGTLLLGFVAFGQTLDSIISEVCSNLCDAVKSNCVAKKKKKKKGIQYNRKSIIQVHI